MAMSELKTHVLVVGHGRSGTNMVLDLFDFHRMTFCRNEPNELHGTAFKNLGDPMFPGDAPDNFDMAWTAALNTTFRASGARDRFGTHKDYFRNPFLARLGQSLMSRRRFRSLVLPRQNDTTVEDWQIPKLYYHPATQANALPVLKLLLTPAWINRAHDAHPGQRVVHVLRRPDEFIQSWWGRYVTGIGGGPEKVFADNQPSLAPILQHFGRADDMPQDYSLAGLVKSELWRWRYINEVMIAQISDDPRYLRVPYSDVMQDRLNWAEKLYNFAGLSLDPACKAAISAMQNNLFKARRSDGLEPEMVKGAINDVVGDSPFRDVLLGQHKD